MSSYYGYHLMQDGRPFYVGITIDPQRRVEEHKKNYPFGIEMRVIKAGMTESEACAWERDQIALFNFRPEKVYLRGFVFVFKIVLELRVLISPSHLISRFMERLKQIF